MNPLNWAARVAAAAAHDVVAEFRRLDAPPPPPSRTEINNVAATTQTSWQPVRRAPASAFGFNPPGEDSQ